MALFMGQAALADSVSALALQQRLVEVFEQNRDAVVQ